MSRTESNNTLYKEFVFKSFEDAMTRMHRCSYDIVHLDHHPQRTNIYNSVQVTLTTHDASNTITDKDYELAKVLDEQYLLFHS